VIISVGEHGELPLPFTDRQCYTPWTLEGDRRVLSCSCLRESNSILTLPIVGHPASLIDRVVNFSQAAGINSGNPGK
jgi:hypothetical protein